MYVYWALRWWGWQVISGKFSRPGPLSGIASLDVCVCVYVCMYWALRWWGWQASFEKYSNPRSLSGIARLDICVCVYVCILVAALMRLASIFWKILCMHVWYTYMYIDVYILYIYIDVYIYIYTGRFANNCSKHLVRNVLALDSFLVLRA